MFVRIAMIQHQTGATKSVELRIYFGSKLRTRIWIEEYGRAASYHIGTKVPGSINEVRNRRNRKQGPSVDQHEVQPNAKRRHPARPHNGVCRRRPADHQARCGKNAAKMGRLDSIIDFACRAEIVSCDNKLFQAASRRVRRK